MDINQEIAEVLNLPRTSIDSAIALLDEGSTVPFISRYRKEVTGGLTDENLRNIEAKLIYLRSLEDRKKTVFASLAEQNITDEKLLKAIEDARTLAAVEDYYRPYKPKKQTRASKAKKAGLEPLSQYLRTDKTGNLKEEAKKYLSEEYNTEEKCIQGAYDILAEQISDNPNYRIFIKNLAMKEGVLTSEKIAGDKEDDKTYDNYASYSRKVSTLKGYHVLAINRGVERKVLSKKLVYDDERILQHIEMIEIPRNTPYAQGFKEMILDSYNRLIRKSVDNDIFADLMDKASDEAIDEFKISLKETLLQSPLKDKRILGFDPGFFHGCKLAFIDASGKVLDTYVLPNPFTTQASAERAKALIKSLLTKNKTDTVALGNGTASRESEKLLKEIKKEPGFEELEIVIVSESGASIWSATEDAQKEFPNFEPNLRSAVSIARRLEDPLAELVKIPPESIGVGQYQYDIEQKKLKMALDGVVEDCVNYVGVDVNTASAVLLSHISGISMTVAKNLVSYRDEKGKIQSRQELKKVKGLGDKAFENAAGFLRVEGSKEPLDNSAVHPESYPAAKAILSSLSHTDEKGRIEELKNMSESDIQKLSTKLNVGEMTLTDIIHELIKPTRDPRDIHKVAHLNDSVTDIKDVKPGMLLEGTIRNVTGFGFFVDLGVEVNGLVHISEISDDHYVSDPHKEGKPGDVINVKVKEIDLGRNRISLTMKGVKQRKD